VLKPGALVSAAVPTLILSANVLMAAEEGASERNIFNSDVGNFIFTLIIFGLVVYFLGKFAWKPLLNVLNEREETIRSALVTAKQERQAAEHLLHEYQAQLDKAREEATALVAEGRKDAEAVRQHLKEEAQKESEQIITRARREIQLATDSARKELHDEASELAVRVAGRIIRKELSAADHQALVAESLKEMLATGRMKLN
jgi:F-type H+-transporting ATPase subunit b